MKIGLAQINTCIGDLEGNVNRCLDAVESAHAQGAQLIVLPEMAVPGCPPRDILYDSSFTEAVYAATDDLARRSREAPPILVGTLAPTDERMPRHPGLHNVAALLSNGSVRMTSAKRLLPADDVYFEPRWFLAGQESRPVTVEGCNIGLLVGHDLWDEGFPIHPSADLIAAGAELLVCLSASPYDRQVQERRLHHARRRGRPLVVVNACGAGDELIFDGRSFVTNADGEVTAMLKAFEEDVRVVDLSCQTPVTFSETKWQQDIFNALVLGVRDFARKNRIKWAFLGLSGGVDSALTAVIASEALGPGHVTAVAIPSRYTDPRSTESARELAANLGIQFEVVDLEHLHRAAENTLGDLLQDGTGAENIQARLRAMILMSFVNRHSGMLLNTSNKTELSLGYSTLYGDTAGILCPIADLTKSDVAALASWIGAERGVMPRFILERPPTAELCPDQVDPFDYGKVSTSMEQLVRENRGNEAMKRSEYKRWQMGVILKVSEKAFGSGRLIPISRR